MRNAVAEQSFVTQSPNNWPSIPGLRQIFPGAAWLLAVVILSSLPANKLGADDGVFPQPRDTQRLEIPLTTPQEALRALRLPAGFQATLFAAEPDVRQPISLATDDRGRLWVLENYTYARQRINFDTRHHRDRIVILSDTDGDGRHDQRTVFWDQGERATSIAIGFGGVWVLAAPNLLFIPDADRDDVPDGPARVVLDGWDAGPVRHNIVNGLRWGPDGWLYGRHGIQATSLVGTPETVAEHRTPISCGIWRYHPQERRFEVVAQGTTNPWGMDWDEHGQLFFINTVIGHLWHAIPGAYFQRMYGDHFDPHVYELLPQTADHYHWDQAAEAWHDTKKVGVTARTDAAGGGHAHQGMMIYGGDNWPEQYRGQLFTFNFHGRRVNVEHLHRHGATYIGRHGEDFMRSSDPWFRGIEMLSGPAGGVWMADWSDIGECHENDGVHRGSGRIFRVTHGAKQPAKWTGDLQALSSQQLVSLLAHRNNWFARHARRILQERAAAGNDMRDVRSSLQKLYQTSAQTTVRLRAMWAMHAVGGLRQQWLNRQLASDDEHIRVWAVRLLSDLHAPSDAAQRAMVELARRESSGLVLCFLTSVIRTLPHEQRWPLAAAVSSHAKFADDPYLPLLCWYAVEPAVTGHPDSAVRLALDSQFRKLRRLIARRLAEEIERQPQAVNGLLVMALASDSADAKLADVLPGIQAGLLGRRRVQPPDVWPRVQAWASDSKRRQALPAAPRDALTQLNTLFADGQTVQQLRELAASARTPLDLRRRAIQSLVEARAADTVPLLYRLLGTRYINVEAIRGLAAFAPPDAARRILQRYGRMHQPARRAAIDTLVSRPSYAAELLGAIEDGRVPREAVSVFQVRQLQHMRTKTLDDAIGRIWPDLTKRLDVHTEEKRKQIAKYRRQLTAEVLSAADLSAGRTIFEAECAKCHQLFDRGAHVGPPLTGAQRTNLQYLLENIIDPSAQVAPEYRLAVVITRQGQVLSGILLAEDEQRVTLRTTDQRHVLLREEIEELTRSPLSLMPERQLDVMTAQQVRDLIGYLMSPRQVELP